MKKEPAFTNLLPKKNQKILMKIDGMSDVFLNLDNKGQIISECSLEILDFPKIPREI